MITGAAKRLDAHRLLALDGLRGVLIMYVMVIHSTAFAPVPWLKVLFFDGFLPVDLFFALSGFVLMYSFFTHGGGYDGWVVAYFQRRTKRLTIPYFGALAISLLVLKLTPFHLRFGERILHDQGTVEAVIVHVLMLQNVFSAYVDTINTSLWFVAMEMQLSLIFPVIVYVWRRCGVLPLFVIVCGITALCLYFFQEGSYFFKVQYLLLFIVGMVMAHLLLQKTILPVVRHRWWIILVAGLASLAVLLMVSNVVELSHRVTVVLADLSAVFVAIGLLMACVSDSRNVVRWCLESRPIIWLGSISYAAYLLHFSVFIVLDYYVLLPISHENGFRFLALTLIGIPLSLLLTMPFHLMFKSR